MSAWQAGEALWRYYDLEIPGDAVATFAELRLALLDQAGQSFGDSLTLDRVTVDGHRFSRPEVPQIQEARIGESIRLLGYDLQPTSVAAGKELTLTLYWHAFAGVNSDYTVFTHLLGPDGVVYGQRDSAPLQGRYPTGRWLPGEYLVDTYVLEVSADASSGDHVVEVGMYDPTQGAARVPLYDAEGQRLQDDRLLLGQPVRVER